MPTTLDRSRRLAASSCLAAVLLLLASGCESRSEVADAGMRGGGGGVGGNISARVDCDGRSCAATVSDARWGAEPCCLEADDGSPTCGLRSDAPRIAYGGREYPVSELLEAAKNQGQAVANTEPTIACMPRNQAGEADPRCPDAEFIAADAGLPDASAPEEMLLAIGCCRPDGACGYLDTTTGFGCVRVSESLIGQALGHPDVRCD